MRYYNAPIHTTGMGRCTCMDINDILLELGQAKTWPLDQNTSGHFKIP